ncbi:hypothetical protein BCR34DRAFT_576675 [Clohesyomyces aquaticus]|uniref:Uncharacterized protein n=1 Tax=Clohesyomyces aquaticus TaxID=1231657 RepID=A0A1Y1YMP6_9PLEO|nr:hypothetical protein BCR34DRAFT_576675 [Clohesyomyces aquaticus]
MAPSSSLTTQKDKAARKASPKHVNFTRQAAIAIIPADMETWANSSPPSSPTPEQELWARKNVDAELAALGGGLAEPTMTVADQKPQAPKQSQPPKKTFGDILGREDAVPMDSFDRPPKPKRKVSDRWQSAISGIIEKGKGGLNEKPRSNVERSSRTPSTIIESMRVGKNPSRESLPPLPPRKHTEQTQHSQDARKSTAANPAPNPTTRVPPRKPMTPPKPPHLTDSTPTLRPSGPAYSTNRKVSAPPKLPLDLGPSNPFSRSEEALHPGSSRSPFQRNAFPSPEIHPLRGNPVSPPQIRLAPSPASSTEPPVALPRARIPPSPASSTQSLDAHKRHGSDFSSFVPVEQMATMDVLDEEERERKAAQPSSRFKDKAKRFSKKVVDKAAEEREKRHGGAL